MSDVSFARAGWIGKAIFVVLMLAFGAFQWLPKITTRQRFAQLLDREVSYDLAVSKIEENQRLREALDRVREIIKDGAMTGFNCHDGDWAERLFASQGLTFDALRGNKRTP